jgi:uncharacterized protein DUF3108
MRDASATPSSVYHTASGLAIGFTIGLAGFGIACLAAACSVGSRAPAQMPAAAAPSVSLAAVKPFFVPGESITWKVSLAGIEAGRARLAVGEVGLVDGRRVIALRGEGEAVGVFTLLKDMNDEITSWLDLEAGIPARTETESTTAGRLTVVHARRGAASAAAQLTVWRNGRSATDPGRARAQRLPAPDTQDTLSAVLFLRGWEATPGARARVYTLGGERLWRTDLTMEGVDEVDTPLGKRRAFRVAGVSTRMDATLSDDLRRPPRRFTAWISRDRERLPVRIKAGTEFGDVLVEATSYEAP